MKMNVCYAIDFAQSYQQLSPCLEMRNVGIINEITVMYFIATICMKFDLPHKPLLIDSLYFCSKINFTKTITRPAIIIAAAK